MIEPKIKPTQAPIGGSSHQGNPSLTDRKAVKNAAVPDVELSYAFLEFRHLKMKRVGIADIWEVERLVPVSQFHLDK